jgi:hypothetical protein
VRLAAIECLILSFDESSFDFVLKLIQYEHFSFIDFALRAINTICLSVVFGDSNGDLNESLNVEYVNNGMNGFQESTNKNFNSQLCFDPHQINPDFLNPKTVSKPKNQISKTSQTGINFFRKNLKKLNRSLHSYILQTYFKKYFHFWNLK